MDAVVRLLLDGGVLGYPTETVYGLGGDAFSETVVRRIQRFKDRDEGKAMLVLIPGLELLESLVEPPSPRAIRLVDSFWPGPLTLIFQALQVFPQPLLGPDRKVGLRISPDPFCMRFLEQFGRPLVSTSANPSGRPPAISAEEVLDYFGTQLELIVDGGNKNSVSSSSVLDVSGENFYLLREGAVSKQAIENVIGEVDGS